MSNEPPPCGSSFARLQRYAQHCGQVILISSLATTLSLQPSLS